MYLKLNNYAVPLDIQFLREAVTICRCQGDDGRVIDEGETIATVDKFGKIYDVEGKRVEV